jgi:4-hydroxybenzoate polyprenyltransferase
LLSFYFGLVFAAGHLSQEVRDHDGDRRAGLETAAVRLGPRRAFVVSFALFTIAVGLIVGLGLGRMAPPLLAGAAAAVYPVQALFFARALRDGLTFAAVDRYRARYRLLYALTGLALVLFPRAARLTYPGPSRPSRAAAGRGQSLVGRSPERRDPERRGPLCAESAAAGPRPR